MELILKSHCVKSINKKLLHKYTNWMYNYINICTGVKIMVANMDPVSELLLEAKKNILFTAKRPEIVMDHGEGMYRDLQRNHQ